jgi:short-subunit dehydrogenase
MSETWMILGATSTIARAFSRQLADRGEALLLAGRDIADLERQAKDCELRGATSARAVVFDARDPATFAPLVEALRDCEGVLNAAVFVGSMPEQAAIDADPGLIDGVVADSHTGPARFLQMLAPVLEERGGGTVIGVGSVAGDRGRLPNYVYGSAKAAFHTYLSGLRNRLARHGVHVVTVKPGPTDTAMTWGLPSGKLAAPEAVAAQILAAAAKKRNVIYAPAKWLVIMTILRLIPEPLFKKLKF